MAPDSGALSRHGRFSYEVRSTDTDRRDRLHLHALFSMMQEAAARHAEQLGFGAAQFDPQGIAWVLLRVSVRMDVFPSWKEHLAIETWPSAQDKLLGLRDFRFFREDGSQAGAATTSWLVVDAATRRPKRVPVEVDDAAGAGGPSAERSLHFDAPKIDVDPALASATPTLRIACRESDIDRNRHVNNTRYIAWCLDALHAAGLGGDPVTGIDVNYLSELLIGDEADLFVASPARGETLVEGRRGDGAAIFRARILTSP